MTCVVTSALSVGVFVHRAVYGQVADAIIQIKREFSHSYSGNAHIQEVLPDPESGLLPDEMHAGALHMFARCNPIYHNSFKQDICNVPCVVYEGDINEYWLGSIKHGSSCQPFYPTWLISAMIIAATVRDLGCRQLVDIGSGDGRIAFCGAALGMHAVSMEIDGALVQLQQEIGGATDTDFGPVCMDALNADYVDMAKSKTAFVVGGLPQMGGEMLAQGLLSGMCPDYVAPDVHGHGMNRADAEDESACTDKHISHVVVLAGEGRRSGHAGYKRTRSFGGWDTLVSQYGLGILHTTRLPTVWTFDVDDETPYLFAGVPDCRESRRTHDTDLSGQRCIL